MKNSKQEKKDYLISLLKKYWEYDEKADRENIDDKTIDKIYDILLIKDDNERNEMINKYKEDELKEMEEYNQKRKDLRKKAEDLLQKTKKLHLDIKIDKIETKDKKDLKDIEEQISSIDS